MTGVGSGGRPRGRVLVIDDEPLIGSALTRALSSEHDVSVVTSARAAMEVFERGDRFDVVLCDVMMPSMSGMELHARLRESHPDIAERIIFLSGAALDPRIRTFLAQARNTCLAKPPDLHELRDVVRARVADTSRRSA